MQVSLSRTRNAHSYSRSVRNWNLFTIPQNKVEPESNQPENGSDNHPMARGVLTTSENAIRRTRWYGTEHFYNATILAIESPSRIFIMRTPCVARESDGISFAET